MGKANIIQIGESSSVHEPEPKDFLAYSRAVRVEGGWRDVEALLIDPVVLKLLLAEGHAIIKIVQPMCDRGSVDEHSGEVAVRDENRERWTGEWAKSRGLQGVGGLL